MLQARKAFVKNNDSQYTVLGTVDRRRWLMGGDEVSVYNIEVTGWNTRVYVNVVNVAPNPFVPHVNHDRFARPGDLGYIDLKNDVQGVANLDALGDLFTS